MDAARQGIITPEMKAVAAKEYRTEEEIRDLVAKGQVAICANKLHTCIDPNGVGSILRTVASSIGRSSGRVLLILKPQSKSVMNVSLNMRIPALCVVSSARSEV